MSTVEQVSKKRLVRHDEILERIAFYIRRYMSYSNVETLDWLILAAMNQYLVEKELGGQSEIAEADLAVAEKQAETKLYFALAYATQKVAKRTRTLNSKSKVKPFITLTEVIDFLKWRPSFTAAGMEINLKEFFSNPKFSFINEHRKKLKRFRTTELRAFATAGWSVPMVFDWTRFYKVKKDGLSRVSSACIIFTVLSFMVPSLAWHDGWILKEISTSAYSFIDGRTPVIGYRNVTDYIVNVCLNDGVVEKIMQDRRCVVTPLKAVLLQLRSRRKR